MRPAPSQVHAVLALLALGAALGACVISPRSHYIAEWGPAPDEGAVILPVDRSDVSIGARENAEADPNALKVGGAMVGDEQAIAEVVNEALDVHAGDPYEVLVGPREFSDEFAEDTRWDYFRVYLDDPDPMDAPWKRERLSELAELLGRPRVVRVRVVVTVDAGQSPDDLPAQPNVLNFSGDVRIEMELVHLHDGVRLSTGTGRGVFWWTQDAGSVFIYSKNFRSAVDNAVRGALTHLFHGVEQWG